VLPALAVQLTVLALAAGLMRLSLRRGPGEGLFSALPLGLLPSLAMSALFFAQVHGTPTPELSQVKGEWMQRWAELANGPKVGPAHKAEFMAFGEKLFGTMPALYFCFQAAVLGALAAWMRQRLGRLGRAPKPAPLSQWTAPFALVWLVLGPVFWVYGGQRGVLHGPAWVTALAENLLVIGLGLYLFQGVVILGAKMRAWSRDPGTRALTPLVLAMVFASLLLLNGQGLLMVLVLIGLFDPWFDLRRLHPPKDPGATV
jgi:hypothetical protein